MFNRKIEITEDNESILFVNAVIENLRYGIISLDKYANVFGYLFAKAIESDCSWRHGDKDQFRLVVSYSPGDALVGELYTHLQPAVEEKVKIAYDYGKQFYKDLTVFCAMHEECNFEEELLKALVIVQQIGEVYAQTILEKQLEEKE